MPKGNHYSDPVTAANVATALTTLRELRTKLGFIPTFGPDDLTTATISPERLPLADLALKAAVVGTDAMRKSCDPAALEGKIAAYRLLSGLVPDLDAVHELIHNGLNVLGADILFAVNNIHEDVEKDNGETIDLGETRRQLDAYYRKGPRGGDKPDQG